MLTAEEERLIAVLDETHVWPTLFAFKFIVPEAEGATLKALFPDSTRTEERPSSGGKYTAFTFHCPVGSGREVISVYSRVKGIKGLVSL
jgi:hypothetical protein